LIDFLLVYTVFFTVNRVMVRGLEASSIYMMTVFSESAEGIIGPGVDVVIQTPAVSSGSHF